MKRFEHPKGGRKPLLRLHPAKILLGSKQEEIEYLVTVFGMTWEQARTHHRLYGFGELYVTQDAQEECEYHVVVVRGADVPQQLAMGVEVVQIGVRRMDSRDGPFPWRDLQEIKRALLGDDVEAVELYPAMSRRLTGDNKFRYLWAFPEGGRLPIGWPEKRRSALIPTGKGAEWAGDSGWEETSG